jgi:hypothetical protein
MGQILEEKPGPRALALARRPLLIAAFLICAVGTINLYRLTSASAPRNPWEALEVVEAWRSLQGMPVYELSADGHATHMYGALVPWVQGKIFGLTGPNNVTGRLLSLVSSLLTVTLLAICFKGERSTWALIIAWAALLGVDHRSGHYFAENRPDMPALCFGTGALILIGIAAEQRRWLLLALGTTCLLVGFFFKQTVAVFSVVPLLALLLRTRRPARIDLLLASIPLGLMVGVILCLKFVNPAIHHYMIAVPGAYSINWPRAAKFLWELLLDSPLFLVVLAELFIFGGRLKRQNPRVRWLLAVLVVAIPFSAVSHAKIGGWPNSLLPALLAMMALCVLRLPHLLQRLDGRVTSSAQPLALGTFLAVLLLMTTFPHLTWGNGLIVARSRWDKDYRQTLAIAGRLPGTVVCPEDPTIPFYGNGYVGLNLFSEHDARPDHGGWPQAMPERVLEEMRQADFVVDVEDYWGENVDESLLESLGFQAMEVTSIDPGCYRIWRKNVRPVASVLPVFLDRIGQSRGEPPPIR